MPTRDPSILAALLADDRGQDLIEYGLLAAIISIAGIVTLGLIAGRMHNVYVGWDTAVQGVWVPCRPAPAACP